MLIKTLFNDFIYIIILGIPTTNPVNDNSVFEYTDNMKNQITTQIFKIPSSQTL